MKWRASVRGKKKGLEIGKYTYIAASRLDVFRDWNFGFGMLF